MRRIGRVVAIAALAGIALAGLLAAVPAVLLVLTAETVAGRLAGLCSLAGLGAALLALRAVASRRPRARWAGALGGASALLVVTLAAMAPDGESLPGSRVASRFLGDSRHPRFAVANLVPEIDQIKIGTYLVPAADRIIDVAASRRIRAVTMAVYRPMEADPEYRALGSVMSYAYADEDSGHLYEYVPARAPDERLPLFVFLHGSAGNFKAYAWVLRAFADRARVIVVCPSFGFGNWYDDGGVAAVERARSYGVTQLGADPRRVVLAGLSNGGTGVTRAAAASPEAYAGLVFFSAVLEPEVLGTTDFARAASGKPVLLLHGARDDRIEQRWPDLAAARLRDLGATVTYRLYPEEDHFLFFARKDEVLDDLARWIATTPIAAK